MLTTTQLVAMLLLAGMAIQLIYARQKWIESIQAVKHYQDKYDLPNQYDQ